MALTNKWADDYKRNVIDELLPWYIVEKEQELGVVEETVPIAHISSFTSLAADVLAHPNRMTGLVTGYHQLDSKLRGLDPGELIIVSGATGTGKTMFALNMLIGAYLNDRNSLFTTLMFSLEMTKTQVTGRIMNLVKDSRYQDAQEANALPIYFYDSPTDPTLKKMRSAMEQCKKEHGLDIVIIDHLHYFSRSIDNQANEIGSLVRNIKSLAIEFNIPIILLAHTRKRPSGSSPDRAPDMDDLRDSSFIAQDADMVIMLKRDLMDEVNNQYLEIYVTKNRNKGILGKNVMLIDGTTFRLSECAQ